MRGGDPLMRASLASRRESRFLAANSAPGDADPSLSLKVRSLVAKRDPSLDGRSGRGPFVGSPPRFRRAGAVNNIWLSPVFAKVYDSKGLKVLCFDTDLNLYHSKGVTDAF